MKKYIILFFILLNSSDINAQPPPTESDCDYDYKSWLENEATYPDIADSCVSFAEDFMRPEKHLNTFWEEIDDDAKKEKCEADVACSQTYCKKHFEEDFVEDLCIISYSDIDGHSAQSAVESDKNKFLDCPENYADLKDDVKSENSFDLSDDNYTCKHNFSTRYIKREDYNEIKDLLSACEEERGADASPEIQQLMEEKKMWDEERENLSIKISELQTENDRFLDDYNQCTSDIQNLEKIEDELEKQLELCHDQTDQMQVTIENLSAKAANASAGKTKEQNEDEETEEDDTKDETTQKCICPTIEQQTAEVKKMHADLNQFKNLSKQIKEQNEIIDELEEKVLTQTRKINKAPANEVIRIIKDLYKEKIIVSHGIIRDNVKYEESEDPAENALNKEIAEQKKEINILNKHLVERQNIMSNIPPKYLPVINDRIYKENKKLEEKDLPINDVLEQKFYMDKILSGVMKAQKEMKLKQHAEIDDPSPQGKAAISPAAGR
jgi:hypothetical protein